MSSKQISPFLRTWYKWKALRLPWRKRFLVGLDLQGNTYWEFRDIRGDDASTAPTRWRRIVQYPRSTTFDSVKVPPQWHQWLRHVRQQPPTLQEQYAEVRRQQQMKYLAAEADARWEAKPKVMMDGPVAGQTVPVLDSSSDRKDDQANTATTGDKGTGGTKQETTDAIASGEEQQGAGEQRAKTKAKKEDPWKKHRQAGPGEQWQPQAWTPPGTSK